MISTREFPLLESLLGWMNVYISLILLFKMFIIIFLPLYSYKNPFLVDQLSSERFREICSPCIGVDTSLEWRWSSALPRNPNRQWWQCNNLFEVLFDLHFSLLDKNVVSNIIGVVCITRWSRWRRWNHRSPPWTTRNRFRNRGWFSLNDNSNVKPEC